MFYATVGAAQTSQLVIEPTFGNKPLSLDNPFYHLSEKDSLQFTTLKFYISKKALTDEAFLHNPKFQFK
jgi:hypothetical protein